MLTGNGGPFVFGPNDPWTQAIANSSHVSDALRQIKYELSQYCSGKAGQLGGNDNYNLNDLPLWDTANQIVNDTISWLTDGNMGTDPAFLFGSYRLSWNAIKHDCCKHTAEIIFFGSDAARLGSGTRIPYTPIGLLPDQPLGPGMPGQTVPISWTWTENISW